MSAIPVIEEDVVDGIPLILSGTGPAPTAAPPAPESRLTRGNRKFVVYPATAGFEVFDDVDPLSDYALEPNVFFAPRFCVPAMPRLDDRNVYLMVLQDREPSQANTRFVMPYSVEKPGFRVGPDLIRAWANPFGPYGVPLVERRESAQIIDDLLQTLALPSLPLPKVLALPDVFVDSRVVSLFRSVALANNLPIATTKPVGRPVLDATQEAEAYFGTVLGGHHRRNFGRLWRRLEKQGTLVHEVARAPEAVRLAMEEFLLLEHAGWKGRQRTSLASDRYRAAFAREAVNALAQRDKCRVHQLKLDDQVIAALIVFVDAGRAWTWKTAFAEGLSAYSPGTLLVMRTTEALLDDPNIEQADSCAREDHPVMSRLWQGRRDLVTVVIGLQEGRDREVRQAAAQIDLYSSTRKTAKQVRDRLGTLLGRR
ncbi:MULTISPECIES: GNAT family N-acetyltransferase [unclassified Roseitalea]|uniref:GNAT family N-acetyltransferase n=1 Tax=unclassified Roseitalea TaxID=2639107 RepID=UPI00273D72C6|nr:MULTISPECIES: GNAT family N-acetyltransferase [unclassified Roseitalea]